MTRSIPLNPDQLEVLAWVRDGADPGAYDGYNHRIVAHALHNRGLAGICELLGTVLVGPFGSPVARMRVLAG